jgi:PAS domain S-box-containing protein
MGVAMIAWFGPRGALWVMVDALLVVAQAFFLESEESAGWSMGLAALDAVLGAAALLGSWWLYHHKGRGSRSLSDPRSAMLFLFFVPGLGLGTWAVVRATIVSVFTGWTAQTWGADLAVFWLSRALGVLILAPPLLVVVTPWLARRGLVPPEARESGPQSPLGVVGESERLTWGDAVETVGLAIGTSALTWLAVRNGRNALVGWHLWGTPLLLIVWASLRQGLRGSTLIAGFAAALPLVLLREESFTAPLALLVRGNLLGQCAVALLVAASANWVRVSEHRYRQVMAHVPVVIYSARFCEPLRDTAGAADLSAEVTLVSAASEDLLGRPPRELLGDFERWLERVHPDDREVIRAAVVQVSRQTQPVICEYRLADVVDRDLRKHDPRFARVRWVRDTLAQHLDGDGQLIGWEGVLTEITEQRVLADDLRRTTSMLHALVGNLPAGVFFVEGVRGHPLLVNARARHLLGRREDMAAGLEHLAEVYHLHRPDGSPYPVEELPVYLALRKGMTAMREDIIVHRPDGRRVPLVSWAAPVTLTRGNPLTSTLPGSGSNQPDAAVWVLEDLTALHKAEAARRDTEGRLRAILETMAEGLIVQDSTGLILDCNTTAAEILGHSSEQMRGMTRAQRDWILLREDGSPLPPEEYPSAMVFRLGRPMRNLVLGIRKKNPHADNRDSKDTPVRWVLANAMPLGGGMGDHRASGVVTTFVDVSAYVQAQKTIRESEEKYRNLVESLPLMVILSDRDLRLTYANPATSAITGYSLSEISDPQAWASFVYPEDLPRVVALTQRTLQGRGGRVEYRYRTKDGSEKVGLAMSEPRYHPDGALVGTTTLIVDITRERQLERDLLRAQRLELVGRLSSGIAHDFNNLLSVVLSLTELVDSSLSADHAGHADLARIKEATEQAANLANQLLTLGKQRPVSTRRIDVNCAAQRSLELFRATLPPNVELHDELSIQDLFIQADETQFQQVLMNLCLNGREAMPEGGQLQVRTERVANGGKWVRLSVRDNGTGIPDHVKPHLFDPFFSTKDRGTGLGLAVVRQIVESHGGRVEVSSELGCGACFDTYWPAANEDGQAE